MFARIATLRSRSSATRWYSSAFASAADVLAARASSASISSSRHTRGRSEYTASTPRGRTIGLCERHAEIAGVARREQRVEVAQTRVRAGVLERDRRARLHDVPGEPRVRRAPRVDGRVSAKAAGGRDDERTVVENMDRAGVRVEQFLRLRNHLVEYRLRIELGRQQPPHAGELLCERTRAPLGLVQLASLECPARSTCEVLGELEIVVAEPPRLVEEHGDEPCGPVAGAGDRHRQERAEPGADGCVAPGSRQALVLREHRGGDHAPVRRSAQEGLRTAVLALLGEELGERRRQIVRAAENETPGGGHQRRCRCAAERLGRGLCDSVERRSARQGLAEHRRDPIEAALHTGLARRSS